MSIVPLLQKIQEEAETCKGLSEDVLGAFATLKRITALVALANAEVNTLKVKKIAELKALKNQIDVLKSCSVEGSDKIISSLEKKQADILEFFKDQPAGAEPAESSEVSKKSKPKHVVPCKSGTTCKYGFACTFYHTKDERASFKKKSASKSASSD
jgi:hypothetical protein